MIGSIVFYPLLPWPAVIALGALALAAVVLAVWRGLSAWALRALALSVIALALAGPTFQQEDRAPLSDIVLVLEDRSASQSLAERL